MPQQDQIDALRAAASARTHRITDWHWLALYLYRKMYGRRCVECSQIVEESDATLFTMEGLDEVILTHERCAYGPAQKE